MTEREHDMTFKIYTEDKNRDGIKGIVGRFFDGYTLITGEGVWKGISEPCLIIEIVTDHQGSNGMVNRIAEDIKRINQQESVLVVCLKGYHHFAS